jgi:hypothetical protein
MKGWFKYMMDCKNFPHHLTAIRPEKWPPAGV